MPVDVGTLHNAVQNMPIYQSVVMGALQGLAEFAPISSSAHLVLVPWLFGPGLLHYGWVDDPGQAFDAALHIGTALALIIYFWNDWKRLLGAWISSLSGKGEKGNADARMMWLIIIATIPGAVIGKVGEKRFEEMFDVNKHPWAPGAIAALLVVMGLVLWGADRVGRKERELNSMSWRDAILIGVSQVLALFPGVSRSGATITAGLGLGLRRETAARFSFLISTPITLGAGLLKVASLRHAGEAHPGKAALVVGVIVSAIVGYAVIRWMLSYLQRQNMNIFVVWRVAFGLIVFAIWLMRSLG